VLQAVFTLHVKLSHAPQIAVVRHSVAPVAAPGGAGRQTAPIAAPAAQVVAVAVH